jgi:hypothetical protein
MLLLRCCWRRAPTRACRAPTRACRTTTRSSCTHTPRPAITPVARQAEAQQLFARWQALACGRKHWTPLIAAVNGVALGGGTELALLCDVIIASSAASFGLVRCWDGRSNCELPLPGLLAACMRACMVCVLPCLLRCCHAADAVCCVSKPPGPTSSAWQPEVTLGVIPGIGGTQRLPRLIGRARATDVMLTASRCVCLCVAEAVWRSSCRASARLLLRAL